MRWLHTIAGAVCALLAVAGVTGFMPGLPRAPGRRCPAHTIRDAARVDSGSPQSTWGARRSPEIFKSPIRIGLLVEPTPFTHVSGYSNRYKEMLKYLDKAGDVVEIVTTDDVPDAPGKFMDYNIHYTPGFRFPLYKHICLTTDLKMVAYNVLKIFKPHIMHVATPGFFCIASCIYARLLRIPLVLSYHTHLPIYARDYLGFIPGIVPLTKFVLRMVHNLADLVLVTSPQLKEELAGFGIKRLAVWKKGIDTEKFNPRFASQSMRERLTDGHPEAPLLVYVGRLGAEKKLKTLRGVLERIPEARLAIVGTGPAEEELREHFKGTKTVFTGVLHGKELSEAFATPDVFLMPSDSETLGFVVLESMASGVPVVAADAGGIPDLVQPGKTGYLVPVGDEEAFAQRVRTILGDKAVVASMKKASRAYAEQWDWESATMELRNVHYKEALRNFNSRSFDGLLWPNSKGSLTQLKEKVATALFAN